MYRPVVAESLASILELLRLPANALQVTQNYEEDWSVEPEARSLLQSLAEHLQPGSYLEVGAHKGHTFFAVSAKLPVSSRAYAIEPDPTFAEIVRSRIAGSGDMCAMTLIEKESRIAFNDWGREGLDMVFIDGDHSLSETLFDIAAWSTLLTPSGIIIIHDTVTRLERRFPEDYVPNPWDFDIIDVVGLRNRTSSHAWEGIAFLKWRPEVQERVRNRLLRGTMP
jgi:predicted O-methyltransferase YrrM